MTSPSISQQRLARLFARGDDPTEIPAASNIEVESAEGSDDEFEAYIVGYNWAMYAGRLADGSVVLFDGWYGYSNTTSKQLGKLRRGLGDYRSSDLAPKVRSERHAEKNRSGRGYEGHGYPA